MSQTLEALASRLKGRNLSEVARRAQMAYDNVHRIAKGGNQDIYLRTAVKLGEVLDEMDAEQRKGS